MTVQPLRTPVQLLLAPQGPLQTLPPRSAGAPGPPSHGQSGEPGQCLHPSWPRPHGRHHSAAEPAPVKTGYAPVGLLVSRRPATGHQGLQFLPLLRTQLDTVSLHRHPLLTRPNPLRPMPRRIHLASTQFKDVRLLRRCPHAEWNADRRVCFHTVPLALPVDALDTMTCSQCLYYLL